MSDHDMGKLAVTALAGFLLLGCVSMVCGYQAHPLTNQESTKTGANMDAATGGRLAQ